MKPAALITGAARRIGREVALRLAGEGWDIALHYSSSAADAERTAGEIEELGAGCELIQADLSDSEQVATLVARGRDKLPGLNVLVNNASIFQRSPILETTEEFYDRHMAVNLRAPFFLMRDFARFCAPGQIINLLDTRIGEDSSAYAAYALAKKGLAELTRMAAREFAPEVRVNGVAPGLILPPPDYGREEFEKMGDRVPLKATGDPGQIAGAVIFLLRSEYITGEVIHVDGGEHLL